MTSKAEMRVSISNARGNMTLLISGCEREYLQQQQQQPQPGCGSCTSSLGRRGHHVPVGGDDLHRNSLGRRTTTTHIHHHHSAQQCDSVMRRSATATSTTSTSASGSRHNTLQRSVRFDVGASVTNRISESDGLLESFPQPPATFSDPPAHDDQQLLRIEAANELCTNTSNNRQNLVITRLVIMIEAVLTNSVQPLCKCTPSFHTLPGLHSRKFCNASFEEFGTWS